MLFICQDSSEPLGMLPWRTREAPLRSLGPADRKPFLRFRTRLKASWAFQGWLFTVRPLFVNISSR